MAKLVGDDASEKAKRVADLMQIIAELTNELCCAKISPYNSSKSDRPKR